MATSLLMSTQDFLKLSFPMFPYNEIFKVKSDLISETSTNFSQISEVVPELQVPKIYAYESAKIQVMTS